MTYLWKFWEFFQNLIVLSSQKQIIDQTLANQLRILLRTSSCIFFFKRYENICTFFKDLLRSKSCMSFDLWVSWSEGKRIHRMFTSCKKVFYYKFGKNLKWLLDYAKDIVLQNFKLLNYYTINATQLFMI